ncbi:MAG: ParB/RepB/Spo0J family partition protein [Actinomycetota bacterium]|nr:ParB/RepB/Spo0J family partition protein [Actinomycetota bacterium]
MVKRGLGRGLSALISTLGQEEEGVWAEEIPVENISPNPNQPRKQFDPQAFEELVASIKEFGLVQPVVVRPKSDGFELVAGERRWKAAKEAGLTTIPAVIKESTDTESLEISLIENLQREDLNAIEEAMAYRQLIEQYNITQGELANRVGRSRVAITNTLRLLQLPDEIKQLITDGDISSGHARALLSLEDPEQQKKLAKRVVAEGLSVRQTENMVRLWQMSGAKHRRVLQPKAFKTIAKNLSETLSARVRVKMAQKKGKIEIEFKSIDELERIYKLIMQRIPVQ